MPRNSPVDASSDLAENGAPSYSFANKIGRIVLMALEEVVGSEGVRPILTSARVQHRLDAYPANNFALEFSFDELGSIQQAMEELYGPRTGRRLARRIGRASFRIGVEDLRPVLGIADVLFRVLPLRTRLRIGLEVLVQMFDRFSDHVVRLEEDDHYFMWVTEHCGVCWGRQTDGPCCDLVIGLLEEGLYWLSGGASFFIEESSCIAVGDPTCTIAIGKRPIVDDVSSED